MIWRCRSLLTISVVLLAQTSGSRPAVAGAPSPISAEDAHKIDALFARWSKPETPGCALGVVKDGATLYEHSYGLADIEHSVPISSSTVFHVASLSKQFTAFAIYLLAKEGRLSIDDDVRKYLPELHDFGKTVTIRNLLHHTSGLRDQWDLLTLSSWRPDDVITQEDVLNVIWRQRELNFPPGDQFLYSNTGYTLLGLIVERVSGMSLRQFTDERIFKPLAMDHSHFHEHYFDLVSNRAYSYARWPDGSYTYVALSYSTVGPSSLFTTIGDLARWDENFYTGSVGGKDLLAEMQGKGRLNSGKDIDYASGLIIGQYRGLQTVEHNGADAGFRSEILRFPTVHFSVIALCNADDADPAGLAHQVSDILLAPLLQPLPAKSPPAAVEVKIDPGLMDAYVGDYQLSPMFSLSVTREGDQLMIQGSGQNKVPAYPSSNTSFFLKVVDAQLTFDRPDSTRSAVGLTLHQNGDHYARRMERPQLTPEQLMAYTGTFYSDELDTLYTISIQDGKLYARIPRAEIEMSPVTTDVFGGSFLLSRIIYQCSGDRRCNSFVVSNGRVQKLRFRRVNLNSPASEP